MKTRFLFFIIITSLFELMGCSSQTNEARISFLVKRALFHEQNKEFSKAELELDKAISLDSFSSYIFVIRGRIRSSLGKNEKAIEDFSKGIELNPKNTSAFFYRGRAFAIMKNEDSAISNYNYAIASKTTGDVFFDYNYNENQSSEDQTDIAMYIIKFYRGASLYEKRRDVEALSDFKFSLKYKYRSVDCQFYIGTILVNRGHQDEGCEYVRKAMLAGDDEAREYFDNYCKNRNE